MSTTIKKRLVNGILLLDKPKDITSNQALQTAKRLFSATKAGHTGSLDPLATGLLPLCFGEATKFSRFLLNSDKTYLASAHLGIQTNTGDAEGEVVAVRSVRSYALDELEAVLSSFRGSIFQVPPMFSALKYKGKPLYQLARQGIKVERSPRPVVIYTLDLVKYVENVLYLKIKCSKGTYIRTLVEEIGAALGCGAYIQDLRRLKVANYAAHQMVSLEKLKGMNLNQRDKQLLSLNTLLEEWPFLKIPPSAVHYLYRHQPILPSRSFAQGWVRLICEDNGRFLGIGEILEDGRLMPNCLVRF